MPDNTQSMTRAPRAGERPWVVKIGGRLCEEPALRARLAAAVAECAAPVVVVHGGGTQISRLQEQLGLSPRFHEGRRITGPADLLVAEMALSGAVNKELVRALRLAGRPAVGVSGCDGNLVECGLLPDLGLVGFPTLVRVALLEQLLEAGWTPIVSPVSLGPAGEAVNVNADEVACAVAAALGAERLLLLSDVNGVRVDGDAATTLALDRVEELIAAGQVTGGMVPKVRSAAVAVRSGVGSVDIATYGEGALAEVRGTRVTGDGTAGAPDAGRSRGAAIDWAALTRNLGHRPATEARNTHVG